jgi:hypothetical protein
MNANKRKDRRLVDAGLLILTLLLIASALSTVVENAVGIIVVIIVVAAVIRGVWPHTVGEWRKDRALIDEVGPLDGLPPITLIGLDGRESIIKYGSDAYPAARVARDRAQAEAAALARRSDAAPDRQG